MANSRSIGKVDDRSTPAKPPDSTIGAREIEWDRAQSGWDVCAKAVLWSAGNTEPCRAMRMVREGMSGLLTCASTVALAHWGRRESPDDRRSAGRPSRRVPSGREAARATAFPSDEGAFVHRDERWPSRVAGAMRTARRNAPCESHSARRAERSGGERPPVRRWSCPCLSCGR